MTEEGNTAYEGGLDVLDLSDAVEPEVIEDVDRSYNLAVINAEVRDVETKNGAARIFEALFRVTDSDSENPKPVRYGMWLPKGTDTKDQQNRAKLRLKKFRTALGFNNGEENQFPLTEEALAGYRGLEAEAYLKTIRDEVYGDKNEVRYFVVA